MEEKNIVDYDDVSVKAPLTSSEKTINPRMQYHFGRKVIKIPLSERNLNEVTIQKYLPFVLSIHAKNASECYHFEKVYTGNSNIFDKERKINPDKKNSIVNENHAYYMVEFKKGYMYGEPIKYSCVDDSVSTDDISYLNKYMIDQKKASKDIEMGEAIFKCGNAYRMVIPKGYDKSMNLDKESPFKIVNLDNKTTFVVYSSHFEKEKLFAGIITTIDSLNPNETNYEVMIYTKKHSYRYKCHSLTPTWDSLDFISKREHYLEHIPIVEYYTNTARLGVIDVVETVLDAINYMSSDSVDNVNDFVNSILAIYNMIVDDQTQKEIEAYKSLSLKTTDPNRPADAKYLVNAMNQADVMVKYEALLKVAYNIVGVPQPTTKTTSGGDTGDARELGGGWNSADIVAKQNEEPLKQGEYILLDLILNICRKMPNCKVDELYPCDIDINFNRTNRDNLMAKTQALTYLYDRHLPLETILNITNLCSNSHEVALAWQENIEAKQKEESERTKLLQQDQQNIDKNDNEGS